MRKSLTSFFLLASCALVGPDKIAAQVHIEANGNMGYTLVNPVSWIGQGAFDARRTLYGGDVGVVFGRRYGRGLQLALDFGYQHLLSYQFARQGEALSAVAEAFRGSLTTRFWFQEGKWFGEAGFGAYRFKNFTDPSITAGVGTLIELNEGLYVPIRARASIVYGSTTQVGPLWLSTGLSYRIGR